MRMAKASKADIESMRNLFSELSELVENDSDDAANDAAIVKLVRGALFGRVGSGGASRVIEGCDILIDEVCDPEKTYLDYKSELKQLIPEVTNEQGERMFYIISYTYSERGILMFWGANNAGYTTNIRKAGRYPESKIRGNMSYYHQGDNATAVPVAEVHDGRYQVSENVWLNHNEAHRLRKRVAAGVLSDEELQPNPTDESATN